MAVPYGLPVRRFQATTVSRWLAMPIAATESLPTCADDIVERRQRATAQISSASCSTQPGCG